MAARPKTKKAEQREATRAKLLAIARELFTERGYAGVGLEEIVRRAGLTRGALYHQFADKKDLLRAVVEDLEHEVVQRIRRRLKQEPDRWERVVLLVDALLEEFARPEVRRLILTDAPAVLGRDPLVQSHGRDPFHYLRERIQRAVDTGMLAPQPIEPLARLLYGAVREAGRAIAAAADPDGERLALRDTFVRLLAGIRGRPPAHDDDAARVV